MVSSNTESGGGQRLEFSKSTLGKRNSSFYGLLPGGNYNSGTEDENYTYYSMITP
jgi:hypothetical protein